MEKIILITGCSSGLGEKIAESLSQNGYTVYAGARDVKDIAVKNGNLIPVRLDITNDKECQLAVEKIIREKGGIDVLINNAGYTSVGPTVNFNVKDFIDILNTNAVGAFRLIKLVYPHMKSKRFGRIINITSLNGLLALPNFGLYSASKHALEALGSSLRYEFIKDGIYVTNLAPGAVASSIAQAKPIPHKPAREKFLLMKFLMPMVTQDKVVNKIRELIISPHPPARELMGADAKIMTLLQRFLPNSIWGRLLYFIWNKK